MALFSMTGFARASGVAGAYTWVWELKSVNSKGLDLKVRVPLGWDAVEVPVRAKAGDAVSRGSVFATLTMTRAGSAPVVKVNEPVLNALLAAAHDIAGRIDAAAPRLDGLLTIKGVLDVVEPEEDANERRAAEAMVIAGFVQALDGLCAMRATEGEALGRVLELRLTEIAALTQRAEAAPGRAPAAIRARLTEQVAVLMETSQRFDPDRLHQEALLLAVKADIREEIDRLVAHVAQARVMLSAGGPVGRKLDFLAQEFNRESNTLCSKANDVELTNIGLALKTVVEQFREQVQNLE